MPLKLAFIGFQHSNCFLKSAPSIGIVSQFWMCLPAEPIGIVMQKLVFYSGLNFSFATTILLARQSLQLLKQNEPGQPFFMLGTLQNF